MMSGDAHVGLRLAAVEGDDGSGIDREELAEMLGQLRVYLLDRGVRVGEQPTAVVAPDPTRSAELSGLSVGVVVTAAGTVASMAQAAQFVQQWRAGDPRRQKLSVTLADLDIPPAATTRGELERIAGAVLERVGSSPADDTRPMSGGRYALLVANAAYRDPALRQLRSPAADVRALADVLRDPAIGGFEVELLTDATEWTVRRRVADFFANRDPDDLLLLYFSCHSLKDQRDRLYLAAEDTELRVLSATAVSAAYVADQMSETASRRVLLVLDCCYSGAFARGAAIPDGRSVYVAEAFGGGVGRIVLTASSATEYAFEGDRLTFSQARPSMFTQALVDGLRTGAADLDNDGEVSVDDLYTYARQEVQAARVGQEPHMWAFGMAGRLVVARSARPASLPEQVVANLASDHVVVRLQAVETLAALLVGVGPRLRELARAELVRLRDNDDSVRVRNAATVAFAGSVKPEDHVPPPLDDPPHNPPRRLKRVLSLAVSVAAVIALMVTLQAVGVFDKPQPVETVVETVVVGVDLPFQGTSKDFAEDTWSALRLYLEQRGGKAGRFTVELRRYDNSTAAKGGWDPAVCTRNAHEHVASANEVAVMGPVNSGCAKLMAPVLNQAPDGSMLLVSHANTHVGLTRDWEPGEPEKYFPIGKRSFARVVASDEVQGPVAAQFAARDLRVRKVFVLNDTEAYGVGVAKSFVDEIKKFGVEVVGEASWNKGDSSYTTLFRHAEALGADAVFLGGIFNNNGGQLVKDKVAVLGANSRIMLIAPDGFTGRREFLALPEAQDAYLTFPALSTVHLKQVGGVPARFITDFTNEYGKEPTSWHALYGVQALQVILAAIERSDGTRKGVRDAVFEGSGITIPEGQAILGKTIHIDPASGDVDAKDVTVLRVSDTLETFFKYIPVTS